MRREESWKPGSLTAKIHWRSGNGWQQGKNLNVGSNTWQQSALDLPAIAEAFPVHLKKKEQNNKQKQNCEKWQYADVTYTSILVVLCYVGNMFCWTLKITISKAILYKQNTIIMAVKHVSPLWSWNCQTVLSSWRLNLLRNYEMCVKGCLHDT